MPYYLIEGKHVNAGPDRLVRAPTKAQAVAHVASADYTVTTPSTDEVVAAMQDGIKVETAGETVATTAEG